jgi:hypothetical protein
VGSPSLSFVGEPAFLGGRFFGEGLDHAAHFGAETLLDLGGECRDAAGVVPALIFEAVVEEGRDGLVFPAPVFDYDGGDAEQVRHVRHARGLSFLLAMELIGEGERLFESGTEHFLHDTL